MAKILELSLTEATRKKVLTQNYQKAKADFDAYKQTYDATDPRSHARYIELFDLFKHNLAKMNGLEND